MQDPGEQPLPGITVKLYRDLNNNGVLDPSDPLIGTQVTNANGLYLFTDLPADDYLVQVDTASTVTLPYPYTGGPTTSTIDAAMSPTTGTVNPKPVHLTAGVDVLTADFGYNWNGVVGDTVFYDTDGNGIQGDGNPNNGNEGENGVPNVTLVIVWDQNGNGVADFGEPALKTANTGACPAVATCGKYSFDGMPPGRYIVQAAGQTVASPTDPTVFGTMVPTATYGEDYAVDLPAGGSVLTADFGFIEQARVSGTVFYDVNHDGTLDTGEPGLGNGTSNVTVTLTGTDFNGQTVSKTVNTNTSGNYSFLVPPGNYTVTYTTSQTDALGYTEATTPTSYSVAVSAGLDKGGLNFGVDNSGSIGNRVWLDANSNGAQDSGEPGIAGVTLELYLDADGNLATTGDQTLVGTTATTLSDLPGNGNGSGNYTFPGLPNTTGSQKYVVKVNTATLPGGYTETGEGDPGSLCTGLPGGCDNQIATTLTGGAKLTNRRLRLPAGGNPLQRERHRLR